MAQTAPIKVLHLVKTAVGATWALRQMRELVQLGVKVHVAMPEGKLVAQYRAHGITVHILDTGFSIRQPVKNLGRFRNLRQIVKAIQPDLIHSHFVSTTLTMRLALRHQPIPRIFQVPGPLHLEHALFKRGELLTSNAHDYWIASCHWTKDTYIQAGIPSNRVFMSFYGTDIPTETPPKGTLRTELNLSDDVSLVGMVAYMYAPKGYLGQTRGLKGHEDLIDALALCHQQGLAVKGIFIGGAWDNAHEYDRQVRQYGSDHLGDDGIFLGTRHDVINLYPDFDIAVHPSHSENLGGAVESLMMGIPTIASNIGGFPDIVIPDETGWLVPPQNPEALAKAIQQALTNPIHAKKMAQTGQTMVQYELDVKNTAKQLYDIYHKIIDTR